MDSRTNLFHGADVQLLREVSWLWFDCLTEGQLRWTHVHLRSEVKVMNWSAEHSCLPDVRGMLTTHNDDKWVQWPQTVLIVGFGTGHKCQSPQAGQVFWKLHAWSCCSILLVEPADLTGMGEGPLDEQPGGHSDTCVQHHWDVASPGLNLASPTDPWLETWDTCPSLTLETHVLSLVSSLLI